ncbi:chromosome partitioning protein ParB [Huaxiibacter chinensis]|uniref:chromosome partitioning protein ParB n=1 Tax=Huaxiibacter chinensis TaxID=2899785 RepID=UPI003D32131E
MANSFKQMTRDGTIKRTDTGMFISLDLIHVREGFNKREDDERTRQADYDLFIYLMNGGAVPPLEVIPRDEGGVWVVEGHRRRRCYARCAEAGKPVDRIHIMPFNGNDVQRLLLTSALRLRKCCWLNTTAISPTGWCEMTTTIRDQLMAALRNNPGLNSALLASLVGMTSKKISGAISSLMADGLIACEGRYGQRLYRLTSYGMRYAADTVPARRIGTTQLVQRTETNVICQECRNSAAMKRVLMVWGRVGV